MDKYYYFIAQLPFLKFKEKPLLGRRAFLDEALKWLSAKEFALLASADTNNFYSQGQDKGLLIEYKEFEKSLRQAVASRRKGPKSGFIMPLELQNILSQSNPLEAEKKMLALRWQFIEEKEVGHYFDLDFLVCYHLKLQILERLFIFDKEEGTKTFDQLSEVNIQ